MSTNTEPIEVMSPNYPNHYDDESSCIWIFDAGVGNRVRFDLDDLETAKHNDRISVRCMVK